ncbi:MAG: hypothetical protein KDC66_23275 [Phaeodactylibacter sp.]|nr:hypothetical protein [Phaeodactylibacter sp.]MCB9276401.1 hypothetical protein [Lewinellaceae bacterium]
MQLKRLQHYFAEYRKYLQRADARERLYIWESQRCFQEKWDMDAEDWPAMYDNALQNSHTRRLWKREAYEPKQMMLELARLQPDFAHHMFSGLFNEEKNLESRASRFVYYCDMLLQEYREQHPRSIENSHYHDDDYHMVFLYLAFRYPDRYTLYDAPAFTRLLELLGSPDIPRTNDVERFAKVSTTLYKLLRKEEGLLDLHRRRLQEGLHFMGESLLVVYDFYQFCTDPRSGAQP